MLKYILLLLVGVYGCATDDPLTVTIVESEERADDDGMTKFDLTSAGPVWKLDEETQVLTASAPATLALLPQHGPLTLKLSFRTQATTRAALMFGSKHSLNLLDFTLDRASAPAVPLTVTPGRWHELELAYRPATTASGAVLSGVYVDGSPVYFQHALEEGTETSGGLTLRLTDGTLDVYGIRYLVVAGTSSTVASDGTVTLHLPQIAFAYYTVDGAPGTFTDWDSAPVRRGFTERFDVGALRDTTEGYAIRFAADLEVPVAGEYTFGLNTVVDSRLYIDDQLIASVGNGGRGSLDSSQVNLTTGNHEMRIDHYQPRDGTRFTVTYTTPDGHHAQLNGIAGENLLRPSRGEGHPVALDDRPYLLRSFLYFPPTRLYQPVKKRTHVVNVGERGGPHYSYDLQRGALLQAWRGDFVDVREMWDGRGEAQVALPLGRVVAFSGGAQWSASVDAWQDSLTDLHHSRYELDADGRPTFYFTDGSRTVSDRILPDTDQLSRTLTHVEGSGDAHTVLATAGRIDELAPGEFALRNPGAKLSITDLPAGKLRLLRGQGIDRLTLSLPPGDHVTYRLSW